MAPRTIGKEEYFEIWPSGFWMKFEKKLKEMSYCSNLTIKGKTPFWVRSSAKQGKDSKIEEDPRYIVLVIIKWWNSTWKKNNGLATDVQFSFFPSPKHFVYFIASETYTPRCFASAIPNSCVPWHIENVQKVKLEVMHLSNLPSSFQN